MSGSTLGLELYKSLRKISLLNNLSTQSIHSLVQNLHTFYLSSTYIEYELKKSDYPEGKRFEAFWSTRWQAELIGCVNWVKIPKALPFIWIWSLMLHANRNQNKTTSFMQNYKSNIHKTHINPPKYIIQVITEINLHCAKFCCFLL